MSVQPRSARGTKDKEGGVGRVKAVRNVNDLFEYDIDYVLGGNEKQVKEEYVSLHVESSTARSSRKKVVYSELNIDNDGNDVSTLPNKKRNRGTTDRGQGSNRKSSTRNVTLSKARASLGDSEEEQYEDARDSESEDEEDVPSSISGGKKKGSGMYLFLNMILQRQA